MTPDYLHVIFAVLTGVFCTFLYALITPRKLLFICAMLIGLGYAMFGFLGAVACTVCAAFAARSYPCIQGEQQ